MQKNSIKASQFEITSENRKNSIINTQKFKS